MKNLLITLLSSVLCNVYASDVSSTTESQIRSMMPNTKINQISNGPWSGTYEVLAGGNAFYVGNDESQVIVGHIINIKTMQDVTQEHINLLNSKNYIFNDLPLKNALKIGSGKKKIAVFIDPDCPYCQQLEAFLSTRSKQLTIYYFFMPLSMHPNAVPHTKQILCSSDPKQALSDVMIAKQELSLGSAACQANVEKQIEAVTQFALEKGINSTPFIITDNNKVIGGFNIPELQKFIEGK